MIFNLLIINLLMVILVDQLNVFEPFLFRPLWRLLTRIPYSGWSFRPFSCSTCMGFWSGLLYIIIVNELSLLNVCFVLLISFFNFIMNDIIIIVKELWTKMVNKIVMKINEK